MFALYVEVSGLKWICEANSISSARRMAALWSKLKRAPVTIIEELDDGATAVVATYKDGLAQSLMPPAPPLQLVATR